MNCNILELLCNNPKDKSCLLTKLKIDTQKTEPLVLPMHTKGDVVTPTPTQAGVSTKTGPGIGLWGGILF
jgi:hypothetical protein